MGKFGAPAVHKQLKKTQGHTKALVMGHKAGVTPIIPASRTVKAAPVITKGISKKFKPC